MTYMKAEHSLGFVQDGGQHSAVGITRRSFKVFRRSVVESHLSLLFIEKKIRLQAFRIIQPATVTILMMPVPTCKTGRHWRR